LVQIVGWNGSLTKLNTPSSKPKYMKERTYGLDGDKHIAAPKTLPSIGGILSLNKGAIPNMFKGGEFFNIILLKGGEFSVNIFVIRFRSKVDMPGRNTCCGSCHC
jgi:hypothetical protein